MEAEFGSGRLSFFCLTGTDADDLFPLLQDERLYRFTGELPPASVDVLRQRYRQLEAGRSPSGSERWLNWCLRRRSDRRAIGFVQATVSAPHAELAWVIGTPWQGHGYAKEAVGRLIERLRELGVNVFTASIRPGHGASEAVASSAGLRRSDDQVDGETVWTLTLD